MLNTAYGPLEEMIAAEIDEWKFKVKDQFYNTRTLQTRDFWREQGIDEVAKSSSGDPMEIL